MSQRSLDTFRFRNTINVGSPPPPSPERSTPTPSGARKRPTIPPADNEPRPATAGISLAEPDRQLLLQLSLQVERMEKALLSSQATSTNRIRELEKQVASITAELNRTRRQLTATPAPHMPPGDSTARGRSTTRAPTPAAPKPQKPTTGNLTWAERVSASVEGKDQQFTTVSRKKKKPTPAPIIPKALPRIEREIIITLDNPTLTRSREKEATNVLMCLNKDVLMANDIPLPTLTLARINDHNKLVLTTNPTTPASAYEPYMQMLLNRIHWLKPISGTNNSRWTKFLVHNIPTAANGVGVKKLIESTYPTLKLMQEPRWLVPDERRLNKQASTMVIALSGMVNLNQIGTNTLLLCNRKCRITEYFSWTPTTQCRNCQVYGHHTSLCKAEKPTCAICAQSHSSKDHQCPVPSCRAGKSCNHPPVKCALCNAAHPATDPLCPIRIKLLPAGKGKAPDADNDLSMEREL